MSCEHLICANCNGPVVEGRCPACREAREHVHRHPSGVSPQILIAVALILLIGLIAAMHAVP
jgi:predicted RNA-binding protein with PUA domain